MLSGKKTYIAGITAVLVAVTSLLNQYVNGEPLDFNLVVTSIIALALIFLRTGIKNEIKEQ